MSHSSTSSSDTHPVHGWSRVQWSVERPRYWWLALLLVVAVVGGAECFVRRVVLPAGIDAGYMPAMALRVQRFEQMRAAGAGPDLLVIGDSTAAHGLKPTELARALGPRAVGLSLANDANAIGIMPNTTVPFLASWTPRVVVLSVSWWNLRAGPLPTAAVAILGSPIIRRQLGQERPLERAGLQMMRLLDYAGTWRNGWPGLHEDGYDQLDGTMVSAAELAETAARAPEKTPIDPERWATIEQLASLTAGRGSLLALVLPPLASNTRVDADTDIKALLQGLAARYAPNVVLIDVGHPPWITSGMYFDAMHVNAEGAARFTATVRDELAAALARRAAARTP